MNIKEWLHDGEINKLDHALLKIYTPLTHDIAVLATTTHKLMVKCRGALFFRWLDTVRLGVSSLYAKWLLAVDIHCTDMGVVSIFSSNSRQETEHTHFPKILNYILKTIKASKGTTNLIMLCSLYKGKYCFLDLNNMTMLQ